MEHLRIQNFLFLTTLLCSSIHFAYAQNNEPKYILASKYFSSDNAMGIIVRYNKGIDSVNLKIDTLKLKTSIERLNIRGEKSLDSVVFYQYNFTPQYSGKYKIPDGVIWSNNIPYPMVFNDSINLFKTVHQKNLYGQEIQQHNKKLENEETFTSKLGAKKSDIFWTDKKKYHKNSTIRIILEAYGDIDFENVKELEFEGENKLKLIKRKFESVIDNGTKTSRIIFYYKAIESGKVRVEPFSVKVDDELRLFNNLKFRITD